MAPELSLVASIATTSFAKIKTENLPKDAWGIKCLF